MTAPLGSPARRIGALAITIAMAATPAARAGALDFFTWGPRIPEGTRRALALYEAGDLSAAAAEAGAALDRPEEGSFREEMLLVRGLALRGAGWDEEAEGPLVELLELEEPSPYYPLGLLELVELRHSAGRLEAVTAACDRYGDARWDGGTRRDARTRRFLDAYGELRGGGPRLTEAEEDLLAHPVRLAERVALRRERPTERLLYLCGIDRLRLGRFAASLAAFDRIAVVSDYEPWAMVGAAQALYASGEVDAAIGRLDRVRRLPASGPADDALRDHAALLGAQMLFDAGRGAEALAAARGVGAGRSGRGAGILGAEIALALGQPGLGLALARDVDERSLDGRLLAEHALAVSEAYARLGDHTSAAAALRAGAARLASERAALDGTNRRLEVERLGAAALADGRLRARAEAARRGRIVAGMRRVLALRGPMSIGKLARMLGTSHRISIVGRPVVDPSGLASDLPREIALAPRGGAARLAYLRSPLRRPIEDAVAAKLVLEARDGDPAASLDALLGLLAGRFATADVDCSADRARDAAALFAAYAGSEGAEPLASCGQDSLVRARELRARMARSPARAAPSTLAAEVRERARRAAAEGLDAAITAGLRRIVATEALELRRLEFELDSALADAMLRENAAARQRSTARP